MRLESKIESISARTSSSYETDHAKELFLTTRPYSGQSVAWFGSAHEESDAHKINAETVSRRGPEIVCCLVRASRPEQHLLLEPGNTIGTR